MNPQNSEVEISEHITDHLDQKMLPSLTANFPKDAKIITAMTPIDIMKEMQNKVHFL